MSVTSNLSNSIIRPGTPSTLIQTLTGNGLEGPFDLAFDGERVVVACEEGDRLSLFRAIDFTPFGSISLGPGSRPEAICNDGLRFWITRHNQSGIIGF